MATEYGVRRTNARLEGDHLVLSREVELPPVCMKCGAREGLVKRHVKLQWTPVWARFLVFCVIGILVMLVTTKRATLDAPLCAPCNARWNAARNASMVGALFLIGALLWLRLGDSESSVPAVVALAIVAVGFVAVLVRFVRPRIFRAVRIDDTEVTLAGVDSGAAAAIVASR